VLTFTRDTSVTWGQLIEAKCGLISLELSNPNKKSYFAVFFHIEISNDRLPEVRKFHFFYPSFILISRIVIFGLGHTGVALRLGFLPEGAE